MMAIDKLMKELEELFQCHPEGEPKGRHITVNANEVHIHIHLNEPPPAATPAPDAE